MILFLVNRSFHAHDFIMITINELIFHYPTGEFNLNIPDFSVTRGSKIAVIGPSGSGKISLFGGVSVEIQSAITALAARGILAMMVETMIPEVFEGRHNLAGIIACAGFLCAYALSMLGG